MDIMQNINKERKAQHDLVQSGIELAKKGEGVSEKAIYKWLDDEIDAPFPASDIKPTTQS